MIRLTVCCPRPDASKTSSGPVETTLHLTPVARFHVIDVRAAAAQTHGAAFDRFARCVYYSHHTTAGYLPQSLTARLRSESSGLTGYLDVFRGMFPEGAGYLHDDLTQREELSPDERRIESRNADAHLAFISGGLKAYVSYRTAPRDPVYFIDLDGVQPSGARARRTTLVGYNDEVEVTQASIEVPVGSDPIQAINLNDAGLGVGERVAAWIAHHGVTSGRIQMSLAAREQGAMLTVNEYEKWLMHYDLATVLRDPLAFLASARGPGRSPPDAAEATANGRGDELLQALAKLAAASGLAPQRIERLLRLAMRNSRLLRAGRCADLLVSDSHSPGCGQLVQGKYQAAILIQWRATSRGCRTVHLKLSRFV